jgi:hypothetical protein
LLQVLRLQFIDAISQAHSSDPTAMSALFMVSTNFIFGQFFV